MLKLQDFTSLFDELVLQVELAAGDDQTIVEAEILKEIPDVEKLVSCWCSAQRIRQWLQNKKRNLMDRHASSTDKESLTVNEEVSQSENVERELGVIVDKIRDKAFLLVCLNQIQNFKQSDEESLVG